MTEKPPLVVMKFGGAALAGAQSILRCGRIIADSAGPRLVVASAMQGVTDGLHAAVHEDVNDEAQILPLLEGLKSLHEKTLAGIAPDGDDAASYALSNALEHLERLLFGIAYTQEVTPRLRDLVQSFGERLSVPLLAAAIRQAGRPAQHLQAEDAGIRSLGPFGNARPDMPAMRQDMGAKVSPLLDEGLVPVITGYYGVDDQGHATLFGRGGSDYVASLVAAAMDASAIELWKDVPGFLSADPRAVRAAALVPALGYDEAAELAHVGARVLHPRSVEPVQQLGIPIHIRCFERPDDPGTVIGADVAPSKALVRSIASREGLAILRLNGPGMAYTPGVAKRVFDSLSANDINILNMSTSQATFALLLSSEDAPRAEAILSPLVGGIIQSMQVIQDRSLVCVVGRGLGETPGSAARILDTVAQAGVNVEMISLGASDIAIDFIVHGEDHAKALRAVHAAFLESDATPAGHQDVSGVSA